MPRGRKKTFSYNTEISRRADKSYRPVESIYRPRNLMKKVNEVLERGDKERHAPMSYNECEYIRYILKEKMPQEAKRIENAADMLRRRDALIRQLQAEVDSLKKEKAEFTADVNKVRDILGAWK